MPNSIAVLDKDGAAVTVATLDLFAKAEDAASANADTGIPAMVIRRDTPANTSGADGDYEMLQMAGGRQWVSGPAAAAVGGAVPYSYIAAAASNQDSQLVKGSAGTLYGIVVVNVNAALRYLKVYDKASGPTSADTPKLRLPIPAATTGNGVAFPLPACGVEFTLGIAFRLTTGMADNDATAVTANDAVVNLIYK